MRSRFAAVRVRAAHRDYWRTAPRDREWLLIGWPTGEKEPIKYWLSTVSEKVSLEALVRLVKMRWRIERDYQEMKDELGLDHYEGRGWIGFHHHGALCIDLRHQIPQPFQRRADQRRPRKPFVLEHPLGRHLKPGGRGVFL
jgi:SRSO17 transposase